jgi:hypothetical protein
VGFEDGTHPPVTEEANEAVLAAKDVTGLHGSR